MGAESLMPTLAWLPGPTEWIIIGVLGLLFFGKRLPEVGKAVAQSIVEFKRGLKGVQEDMDAEPRKLPGEANAPSQPAARSEAYSGKPASEATAQTQAK